MTMPEPSLSIPVDFANPGQFFACCGLLELAHRLWQGACGKFAAGAFEMSDLPEEASVLELINQVNNVGLSGALTPELAVERDALEAAYRTAKNEGSKLPVEEESRRKELGGLLRAGFISLLDPFHLRLDWWQGESDEVPKTWAGSMQVRRVALAALRECATAFSQPTPFEYACVLRPADDNGEDEEHDEGGAEGKAEPFYFDSTRGTNATPLDIGFSPNKLSVSRRALTKGGKAKSKQIKMETAAFAAVEFLALVGLQRFRPMPTRRPREFEYCTWTVPLAAPLAAAAACGLLPSAGGERYRFENAFRTDQRKHKGFLHATRISQGETL